MTGFVGGLLATLLLVVLPLAIGIVQYVRGWKLASNKRKRRYLRQIEQTARASIGLFWLERFFFALQFFSPFQLTGRRNPHVHEVAKWAGLVPFTKESDHIRAHTVDWYLLAVFLVDAVILSHVWSIDGVEALKYTVYVYVAVRILDIVQTTFNQSLFTGLRHLHWKTNKKERNVVIAIIVYFEVAALFGVVYWLTHSVEKSIGSCSVPVSPFEAIYFAFVTQATVGFGDVRPHDALGQALVVAQVCTFFPLAALIIARSVSSLASIREHGE